MQQCVAEGSSMSQYVAVRWCAASILRPKFDDAQLFDHIQRAFENADHIRTMYKTMCT